MESLGCVAFNLFLIVLVTIAQAYATTDCPCGYSITAHDVSPPILVSELLETNFLRISDIASNPCWKPQTYQVSASGGRGEYGKLATPQNVIPNPCPPSSMSQCSTGARGGDAGLRLWVNSTVQHGMVPMGEILSNRGDVLYGSFRVRMKVTGVPGTCGAFFWFRNDSEEIDMELLSSAYNSSSHPVFLVLQTPESVANDYNAAGTSTYSVEQLPVNPSGGFHDYRFDWTENKVSFYFDSRRLKTMHWTYPRGPGHLTINHWSNGNPGWSRGPPKKDAVLTVASLQAFFNSSNHNIQKKFEAGCPHNDKPCQVDDRYPDSGPFHFFNGHMCGEDRLVRPSQTAAAPSTYSYRPNKPPAEHRKTSGATRHLFDPFPFFRVNFHFWRRTWKASIEFWQV